MLGACFRKIYFIYTSLVSKCFKKFQVPPSVLSEKLAKRTFIYGLSFDWIEKALDVLIGKNMYFTFKIFSKIIILLLLNM